jgi:hypothetical protein
MSAGKWDEIAFDKIPSKAGFIYKNAFARHDIQRLEAATQTYAEFVKDKTTSFNTKDLYPYEIVSQALHAYRGYRFRDPDINDIERLTINKYWDNYLNTINEFTFNGLAVVDTSGSMIGTPMDVAISLGIICAKKAQGPFKDHYISFSSRPQLIKVEGVDFVDTVGRIYSTNLCENTNIVATFDLLLKTAMQNHCTQEEIPENIIIISDMEFDSATRDYWSRHDVEVSKNNIETVLEAQSNKWATCGYKMPNLIFWNVDARHNNIPMLGNTVSYVSGMSPSIYQSIATGKTGYELMMDKLNAERYDRVK